MPVREADPAGRRRRREADKIPGHLYKRPAGKPRTCHPSINKGANKYKKTRQSVMRAEPAMHGRKKERKTHMQDYAAETNESTRQSQGSMRSSTAFASSIRARAFSMKMGSVRASLFAGLRSTNTSNRWRSDHSRLTSTVRRQTQLRGAGTHAQAPRDVCARGGAAARRAGDS